MVHHGPSHWISVRDAPKTSRTWSRLVPIEDMEKPWGNPGETMGKPWGNHGETCIKTQHYKKMWNIVQQLAISSHLPVSSVVLLASGEEREKNETSFNCNAPVRPLPAPAFWRHSAPKPSTNQSSQRHRFGQRQRKWKKLDMGIDGMFSQSHF